MDKEEVKFMKNTTFWAESCFGLIALLKYISMQMLTQYQASHIPIDNGSSLTTALYFYVPKVLNILN